MSSPAPLSTTRVQRGDTRLPALPLSLRALVILELFWAAFFFGAGNSAIVTGYSPFHALICYAACLSAVASAFLLSTLRADGAVLWLIRNSAIAGAAAAEPVWIWNTNLGCVFIACIIYCLFGSCVITWFLRFWPRRVE